MKFISTAIIVAAFLAGSIAMAADECNLSIDRTPCPGKEEEARKPYSGKNPTDEKTKAKDAEVCMKDAEKAAKIVRKGTLSKKIVTAKFGGKDLGKKEYSAECK